MAESSPRFEMKEEELLAMAQEITEALKQFGATGRIMHICQGPVITNYEFKPDQGVSASKVFGLLGKLKTTLKLHKIRIEPIPGKDFLGIGILNHEPETIYLREVVESKKFKECESVLAIALGKQIDGSNYVADFAELAHLFIAGATSRRKTVGLDAIINSILYKSLPYEVKFIMASFTRKELEIYADIPHLAMPIITDPKRAANSLKWAVLEMENRYKDLADWGIRNIDAYNNEIKHYKAKGLTDENGEEYIKLPYIVIIIDELANLDLNSDELENTINQLSRRGHNVGIHLILATQQPSVEMGKIISKAGNFSKLISHIPAPFDARSIANQNITNNLITRDEMILFPLLTKQYIYLSESFLGEREIHKIVEHIKAQAIPEYDTTTTKSEEELNSDGGVLPGRNDDLFWDAVRTVVESKKASTSLLQRHLRIGYARAAAILDAMIAEGYIGEMDDTARARPVTQKAYEAMQDMSEQNAEQARRDRAKSE